MSNTITIDNVPEGFELTGEYRPAKLNEYYLWQGEALNNYCGAKFDYPILRKLEPPTPPDGFEHAKEGGECRTPKAGEYWINKYSPEVASGPSNGSGAENGMGPRWILRKKWTPPKWLPEGCWLWKGAFSGTWKTTKSKPMGSETTGYYTYEIPIIVDDLAALHGETFVPPTHTNCLQVKHET